MQAAVVDILGLDNKIFANFLLHRYILLLLLIDILTFRS